MHNTRACLLTVAFVLMLLRGALAGDLAVKINGKALPLTHYQSAGLVDVWYAGFTTDSDFQVNISLAEEIKQCAISPKRLNVAAVLKFNTVGFTGKKGQYYSILANGMQLFLFAEPSGLNAAPARKAGVFEVWPAADGLSAQERIQLAIDSAAAYAQQSGHQGTVYVRSGLYEVLSLQLKSHIDFYLSAGAVLKGTGAAEKVMPPNYAELANYKRYFGILVLSGLQDVTVYGRGTIDGNGILLAGTGKTYTNARMRVRGMVMENCTNIKVKGLTLRESTSWALAPVGCSKVSIDRVKVINPTKWKVNDGINIVSSKFCVVSNCFVYTGDDAYCAKADVNGPVEDVVFKNNLAWSTTRGAKCGLQGASAMRNVSFIGLDILQARNGIDIYHDQGEGKWEQIYFKNIHCERLAGDNPVFHQTPLSFKIWPAGGSVSHVYIENYTCDSPGTHASMILGKDRTHTISNVHFKNLVINGHKILNVADTRLFELNNYVQQVQVK